MEQAPKGKSNKKMTGIIVACTVAIIVAVVLFSSRPWERTYTLSVSVNPSGAGSISGSGGEYRSGTQMELTASPASGYTFDRWSGSTYGDTPTITIIMDSDVSLTAHFTTAATAPEVLFSDDFSGDDATWDTGYDEDGSVFYGSGWLHLINYTSATYSTTTVAHQYLTDFVLDVETKLVAGTDNNWQSVTCRNQHDYSYYEFCISADGYYYIGTTNGLSRVPLTGPNPVSSSYINRGVGAVNTIHIECIGSKLSLSANGHELASVTDATFTGGDIGFQASALEASSTEIAFDNLVVSEP